MKIVNLDGYTTNPGDLSWEWMNEYGDVSVFDRTPEELILERAKDAEILFINKTPISRKTMEQMPQLRYVGLQSTGYNIIDCAAAKELGIVVTNIPEYSTSAVAQLTFAFILELANHVALHTQSVLEGDWCTSKDFCYWKSPIMELQDKTIGIIGYGKIGQAVARVAEAFHMNIIAYSPSKKEKGNIHNLTFGSIDKILEKSDIVTLHCPLTPLTKELINREALQKMKPTAFLINTSRGPVIDEAALAEALNTNIIAGAGLDVLTQEPCEPDNPLLKAKNCFITPHIAWAGLETRSRLIQLLEANLKAYLNGKPINVVNF